MTITREKISGMIGTAIFFVLLMLILLFSYLSIASPPEELEGIPVMFGNVADAAGSVEPPMAQPVPQPSVQPRQPTPNTPQTPLITQNTEPTINVNANRDEERRRERERLEAERRRQQELAEQRRIEEEAARRRREEEARRREINNQMSGLFGESQASRGNSSGTGTQGVSTGNSNTGATSGTGGIGSYDLGGRSLGAGGLVQPKYAVDDYGTIVVNITVDPQGNVIHAEIGRGTNTPNAALRNEAIRAARNTKFNAINSANNQKGTITYKFNLN